MHISAALNLYSAQTEPPQPDPDVLHLVTSYLERGMADYAAATGRDGMDVSLQHALNDWTMIEQGTHALIERHGFDRAYAGEMLRDLADDWHRTLAEQARLTVYDQSPPVSP